MYYLGRKHGNLMLWDKLYYGRACALSTYKCNTGFRKVHCDGSLNEVLKRFERKSREQSFQFLNYRILPLHTTSSQFRINYSEYYDTLEIGLDGLSRMEVNVESRETFSEMVGFVARRNQVR